MTTMFFIAIDVLQCLAVQTAAIDNPSSRNRSHLGHLHGSKKDWWQKVGDENVFSRSYGRIQYTHRISQKYGIQKNHSPFSSKSNPSRSYRIEWCHLRYPVKLPRYLHRYRSHTLLFTDACYVMRWAKLMFHPRAKQACYRTARGSDGWSVALSLSLLHQHQQ